MDHSAQSTLGYQTRQAFASEESQKVPCDFSRLSVLTPKPASKRLSSILLCVDLLLRKPYGRFTLLFEGGANVVFIFDSLSSITTTLTENKQE